MAGHYHDASHSDVDLDCFHHLQAWWTRVDLLVCLSYFVGMVVECDLLYHVVFISSLNVVLVVVGRCHRCYCHNSVNVGLILILLRQVLFLLC